MLMIVIAIADDGEAGHGLDHIRDPEVDDILAQGAGAGEGDRDQHLLEDQDLYLFADHDPLHSDDLDLVL